ASTETIAAAAASMVSQVPDDYRVSITNAEGKNSYPISSFTYLLVYEDNADAAKSKAIAQFLMWAIHEGQKFGPSLDYARLPEARVKREAATIGTLKSSGKVVLGPN